MGPRLTAGPQPRKLVRLDHADLVDLIRDGVEAARLRWAELGAGGGAFTAALADLIGPDAEIVAVDRDASALRQLERRLAGRHPGLRLEALTADFTKPLGLGDLDGVLMANSLHFVRDKPPVLAAVRAMLKPGGALLMVEYDADRGNPWVPHPFSYETWRRMAPAAGFEEPTRVGWRPSRHLGGMYAALTHKPG